MSDLRPARSLVVAPRMPPPPRNPTGNPFTSVGDMVMDCGVPGCGWHAFGPRDEMRAVYRDHYRQHHASSGDIGVVRLNDPRART